MLKFAKSLAVFVSCLTLINCGGGGSKNDDEPSNVPSTILPAAEENTNVKTGYFLDAAVGGLTFRTFNQEGTETSTGTTDSEGRYTYRTGELITFYLGDHQLGDSVTATEVLTPLDITQSIDSSEPKVTNLLRLLQTLDSDSNPDNGINISAFYADKVNSFVTNLDLTVDDIAEVAEIQGLLSELGITRMVAISEAIEHFNKSKTSSGAYINASNLGLDGNLSASLISGLLDIDFTGWFPTAYFDDRLILPENRVEIFNAANDSDNEYQINDDSTIKIKRIDAWIVGAYGSPSVVYLLEAEDNFIDFENTPHLLGVKFNYIKSTTSMEYTDSRFMFIESYGLRSHIFSGNSAEKLLTDDVEAPLGLAGYDQSRKYLAINVPLALKGADGTLPEDILERLGNKTLTKVQFFALTDSDSPEIIMQLPSVLLKVNEPSPWINRDANHEAGKSLQLRANLKLADLQSYSDRNIVGNDVIPFTCYYDVSYQQDISIELDHADSEILSIQYGPIIQESIENFDLDSGMYGCYEKNNESGSTINETKVISQSKTFSALKLTANEIQNFIKNHNGSDGGLQLSIPGIEAIKGYITNQETGVTVTDNQWILAGKASEKATGFDWLSINGNDASKILPNQCIGPCQGDWTFTIKEL